MYCSNCGEPVTGGDKFCGSCGTTVEPDVQSGEQAPNEGAVQMPYANAVQVPNEGAVQTPTVAPVRKKLSKKALTIIIASGAAALLLIISGTIFLIIHTNRTNTYEEAVALMSAGEYKLANEIFEGLGRHRDSAELAVETGLRHDYYEALRLMERGSYSEAKQAFEALGAFRDSAGLAVECQKSMDYNAAVQLMNSGRFSEAKSAFEALGSFKDSAAMAAECQSEIDYGIAKEYMDSGDYQTAVGLFTDLGTFRDSADLAKECDNRIDYGIAVALMDSGNYTDASSLLEPLAKINFRDSADRLHECNNFIGYALAEEAYEGELFYTAYTIFRSLGSFKDSDERAEQSIQDHPATGQVYRNPDFPGSAVQLRIRTPANDPRPTLIKVYTEDEEHVSSVFIRAGASATVRLPVGSYLFKMAYGENWFGLEEYFGDEDAIYLTILVDNATVHSFSRNYIYTLTLRDSDVYDSIALIYNEGRLGF